MSRFVLVFLAILFVNSDFATADIIAVYDAGSAADGSGAGPIEDLSTAADSIGGITGAFSTTANADFTSSVAASWNGTEFDYAPISTATATWTFGNLTVGSSWKVLTSWRNASQGNLATMAPYTVQGSSVTINQENGATAIKELTLTDGGNRMMDFALLGNTTANGSGEIVVTLSGLGITGGGDFVIADAIAIVSIPEPSSVAAVGILGLACFSRRRR